MVLGKFAKKSLSPINFILKTLLHWLFYWTLFKSKRNITRALDGVSWSTVHVQTILPCSVIFMRRLFRCSPRTTLTMVAILMYGSSESSIYKRSRNLSDCLIPCWRGCHCYNFAWISWSWTFGDPCFLSMGHFLYRFLRFPKNEENLSSRSLTFLQNAPSNSVHLTSSFSCAAVSNASLRVKVCENDGNI